MFVFIMIGQIRANRKQSERERKGEGLIKVIESGFELRTPITQRHCMSNYKCVVRFKLNRIASACWTVGGEQYGLIFYQEPLHPY